MKRIRITKEIAGHRIGAVLKVGHGLDVTDTRAEFYIKQGCAAWVDEPKAEPKAPGRTPKYVPIG